MKKLISICIVLVTFLSVTSCGKDIEPGSATRQFQLDFSDIMVAANGTGSTAAQTLSLQQILPNDYRNVKTSELQNNTSYLEITGLPEGATLMDVKIVANGTEYAIGNVLANQKLSTNTVLNHMGTIVQTLTQSKTVNVLLSYKGGNVPISQGVTIKLFFDSYFTW
ncbi:MAG: hypothetical protein Q4G48_08175 [Bacteroidia bacterium]|nr:hypothetical protein [Bacteroidia bacterium]